MLSTMFVVDALTEQFDRFSGGNIQAIRKSDGIHHLVAYDNGGAGIPKWSPKYVTRYLSWTSRFDPQVAQAVVDMNRFVNGRSPRFLHFTQPEDFLRALGLRKFTASFKTHLNAVAQHIELLRSRHRDEIFFR